MTPTPDPIDAVVRITRALRAAGIDCWTCAHQQEYPCLMYVQASARTGYVWLRPMFTTLATRLEVPIDLAITALGEAADFRLDAGVDPFAPATEGEARAVWQHLVRAAADSVDGFTPPRVAA